MTRARPGWLLLVLAGLAAAFGAFLPFYTYAVGDYVTVWSRGLFPTAALIPLFGVAVGLEAVFVLLRGREPRSPFFNFTWEQARLAAGAFMILLTLSYLLQDRAGGSLGIGYVVLAASSLATFAGGVLTRRAQLARAPGEVTEHRPVIRPALASVSRASSDLVKNISGRGHDMRQRLAERREAHAVARKEAAEQAAVRRAEMQAAAAKEAAEKAAAEKAAAEKAAAEEAVAAKTAAEKAAEEKAAAAKAAEEKAAEEKAAAAKAAADEAATAMAAAEKAAEEKAAAAKAAADEAAAAMAAAAAAHQPAPPTATVESLPTDAHPPAETVEELPTRDAMEQPPPPPATADAPNTDEPRDTAEPEDTAELPVTESAKAADEKTSEQPRVTKLSAVPSDAEPDATPPPDGKSGTVPKEEQEEEEEKETERADTGTEGSPSS
jgi:hypothetical protein